jgi:hypothetical protein
MPGFNSGVAVEAMTYDFTAHGGSSGTIPEPSQGQVETFFERIESVGKLIRGLEKDAKKIDDDDDEAIDEFLDNLPRDKIKEVQDEMSVWISELCSGNPSTEAVRALPYRVFGAFTAWLSGEVGPKDTSGTKP